MTEEKKTSVDREEEPVVLETEEKDAPDVKVEPDAKADSEVAEETPSAEALSEREAALQEQVLRLQADFQNYRRRVDREKKEMVQFAGESIMESLLEIVDDLGRAVASEKEHDAFYEGVKMIYERFCKILQDKGLEEIACEGEAFDPTRHHAVLSEAVEGVSSGTIVETFQRGYTLHGKVLRPAMVKVAQ